MYYRFGKFFYFFSVLVFLLTLLYFYAALPAQIGFRLDHEGTVLQDYEKSTFFYGLAIGFLVLNLATVYTPKTLETKTNQKLHRLFPIGDPFRDYLLTWFYSFGGWVNLSLSLAALFVHAINNQEEISVSAYSLWFFSIPVVLFIWVGALFVLLFKKIKSKRVEIN
ncbi:MAG: DNA topoisomerase IV [Bacteroidetes bacterium]|nr:DNA topoisomerase IV [Bacteroidota bacterium]